jgi:hypothetical protein
MLKPINIALILLGALVLVSIIVLFLVAKNIELLQTDPCKMCVERGWSCFTPIRYG